MTDEEKLALARPHLENAMNAMIEMWDHLHEAEEILGREINDLGSCGLGAAWEIGNTLSIEDLRLILEETTQS